VKNKRICTTKIKADKPIRNQGGTSAIPVSASSSTKYPRNTHQIKQNKQEKASLDPTPSPTLSDLMPSTQALEALQTSTEEVKALTEEIKTTRRGRRKKDEDGGEEGLSGNS
jgi:hypothetical protein